MLPSTPQVEAVYLDPKSGILAGIPADAEPIPYHSSFAPASSSTASPSLPASETASMSSAPSSSLQSSDITSASTTEQRPHTLLIDGTTLDPTAAVRIAMEVMDSTRGGAVMLDAPVSGGACHLTTNSWVAPDLTAPCRDRGRRSRLIDHHVWVPIPIGYRARGAPATAHGERRRGRTLRSERNGCRRESVQ